MDEEYELMVKKLAYVRDNIFNDSDFITDDGYDLTGSYVGSPYEVLCGMEQKILRQQKEINMLHNTVNDNHKTKERYTNEIKRLNELVSQKTLKKH